MQAAAVKAGSATVEETIVHLVRWRWAAIGVFLFASTINYLDRQVLAALAPSLQAEFGFSNAQYGLLVSAFSLPYMLAAPLAGLFVDYVGLNVGVVIAATAWSLTGMSTGLARSFQGLLISRMGLGLSEGAGIPCASKANATYLEPRELGLGNAVQSIGITLGSIAAPLVVAMVLPGYGWRAEVARRLRKNRAPT